MAHRQGRDFVTRIDERGHGLLNCGAGAADHGLVLTIDVGDHHVAIDGFQGALDFL